MLIFGSTLSFLLLSVIVFGAYKCWMGVTHLLSKTFFHQTEERHVKKISGVIIGVTILLMVAPFLIPTVLGFKEFVGALYIVYGGTSLWQIYSWYDAHFGKKNSQPTQSTPPTPSAKPSDKK